MNYLLKNAKDMGLLIFLLVVMASVHFALEQKELKVQQQMELKVPEILNDIQNECDTRGRLYINGVKYTCIPSNAI